MEEVTRLSALSNRRPKWQYPQAPTPRILHLPRRQQRKKQQPPSQQQHKKTSALKEKKGRLEVLFDQERVFSREVGAIGVEERRRGRVEEEERGSVVVEVEEEREKWRFQAEMLRAECCLLRMEREIAVKKLERSKVQMERALKSAVQILVSGRERIHDGKRSGVMMEEDIQELVRKIEKLQRRIRAKDLEVQNCSNFDRQVSLLQRQLDKFGGNSDEISVKEIQEMAEASLSIRTNCADQDSFASNGNCNIELLRREMEKLSRGTLLERIKDEYGSMLSTSNSSASSSASTSKRTDNIDKLPLSAARQLCEETGLSDEKRCSGSCRPIVKKVVEQVRAETEQWSQMQEMLGQVKDEMEELQASREFWEDRALDSDCQVRGLHSSVQEWRRKAVQLESKANELQSQVSLLHKELERLRRKIGSQSSSAKDPPTHSRDSPSDMEKRVLVYTQFKESRCHANNNSCKQKEVFSKARRKALTSNNVLDAAKRLPFVDIGNLPPLRRKNGNTSFSNNCLAEM